jgi:hypothetical protein
VGFYPGTLASFIDKLGLFYLKEIIHNQEEVVSTLLHPHTTIELESVLVGKMLHKMTYQEFKKVSTCFFSYRQLEEEIVVRRLPATQEWYKYLTTRVKM